MDRVFEQSRALNEGVAFFGIGVPDLFVISLVFTSVGTPLVLMRHEFMAFGIVIMTAAAIAVLRMRFRRKIIRDFLLSRFIAREFYVPDFSKHTSYGRGI